MDCIDLFLTGLSHTDSEHRQASMDSFKSCDQSGLGPGASGGMHQPIENQGLLVHLEMEFEGTLDVSEGTDLIRTASWNEVGLGPLFTKFSAGFFGFSIHVTSCRTVFDAGSKHSVEQNVSGLFIAISVTRNPAFQEDVAFQVMQAGSCCSLTGMVRLHGTLSDQCVCALCQGLSNQEFEFTCLVSTCCKSGTVITFDPDFRTTKVLTEFF
jgi:hypothetical protein